jgi:hypothetical protein
MKVNECSEYYLNKILSKLVIKLYARRRCSMVRWGFPHEYNGTSVRELTLTTWYPE